MEGHNQELQSLLSEMKLQINELERTVSETANDNKVFKEQLSYLTEQVRRLNSLVIGENDIGRDGLIVVVKKQQGQIERVEDGINSIKSGQNEEVNASANRHKQLLGVIALAFVLYMFGAEEAAKLLLNYFGVPIP